MKVQEVNILATCFVTSAACLSLATICSAAVNRLVQNNEKCMKLVFDALKWIAGGTDQCFFEQAPRDCLKTHEEAIIACGGDRSTLCYLPAEESWYLLKSRHSTRTAHATTFCDGKLYVVGGSADGGNVAERYDPSLNFWTTIQAPSQVTRHIAVSTFQGCVYAIGGKDDAENRSSIVQKYNPETNQWQKVSPLSSPRSSVCAVASDDHLYAIGGLTNNRAAIDTAERFNLETSSWRMIAPLPEGRNGASGASYNEKLFVFGGVRRTRTFDIYDIATNQWSSIAYRDAPRHFGNVARFKGQVFVFGDHVPPDTEAMETSFQVFDMESHEWQLRRNRRLDNMSYRICTARIPKRILENSVQV